MTCSKNLSDYDRDFMKMLQESKLLIVDLDGTLIDFEKIDNMIIKQLFPDSRIIDTIDNILWKVNRLDVLGNGYASLKIRLAVYSMFSKYTLKECKRMYGAMYEELARVELASVYASTLSKIIANGYKVAIVTRNVYAKNLLERSFFKTNKEISDNLTFGMELKTVNKDNTLFGTVALQVDSEDLISVNYANKDNLFGMKIEDTTEKMIAVRNDNLKDMLEKLGIEDTAEVPDRFLTQEVSILKFF